MDMKADAILKLVSKDVFNSPKEIGEIDELFLALYDLRASAARVHKITKPAPVVLRSEAEAWGTPALPAAPDDSADGPVSDKIYLDLENAYRTDPRSPLPGLRHRTKLGYEHRMKIVREVLGQAKLAQLQEKDFASAYERIKDKRGLAQATGAMTMLRSIVGLCATWGVDRECLRLTVILHRMKFEQLPPRMVVFTAEWANAIRAEAHRRGAASIALAQAFQFACKIKQTDIIGEWVPMDDDEPSEIHNGTLKWVRGMRWSYIDENFVLRFNSSFKGEPIERNLTDYPMVMEELRIRAKCAAHEKLVRSKLPSSRQPVIVHDVLKAPYIFDTFRKRWRKIAKAAGVPNDVESRDSSRGEIVQPSAGQEQSLAL